MEQDDPLITVLHVPDHEHPDDGDVISSTDIMNKMMQAVEDDPTKTVRRVYEEAVRDATEDEKKHIPAFDTVRSKLHRKRASLLHSREEKLVVEHEWAKTWYG